MRIVLGLRLLPARSGPLLIQHMSFALRQRGCVRSIRAMVVLNCTSFRWNPSRIGVVFPEGPPPVRHDQARVRSRREFLLGCGSGVVRLQGLVTRLFISLPWRVWCPSL